MNIIIFAGGAGTRLWPLSRRNSPKQFSTIIGEKSTLQLAVERVEGISEGSLFISTSDKYFDLVKSQVDLPDDHILTEPARRDLTAAVGLALVRLKKRGFSGPMAIIWSDHFMKHPDNFRVALGKAYQKVETDKSKIIFLGETPRFANHNLGWIHVGGEVGNGMHEFLGWKYRPDMETCEDMMESGEWVWNPGYFVFDIDTMLSWYDKFVPEMLEKLNEMVESPEKIEVEYGKLEAIHFDKAILEKIDPSQGMVMKVDLGWSDPGTLYALKESLSPSTEDNYTIGLNITEDSKDCFIYNEDENKLVATLGLNGMVVVNTKDALFVCPKEKIPEIKTLLNKIEDEGLEEYL